MMDFYRATADGERHILSTDDSGRIITPLSSCSTTPGRSQVRRGDHALEPAPHILVEQFPE